MQDLDGGLAEILVLLKDLLGGQRNDGLTQLVFMSAVDGGAAATAGGGPCEFKLLTYQRR